MKKLETNRLPLVAWPWHILSHLMEKEKKIEPYIAKGMSRALFWCINNNFIEGASTSNTSFHNKPIDGAL